MEATVKFSMEMKYDKKMKIGYSTAMWLMFFVAIGMQCPIFGDDAEMVQVSNSFVNLLYSVWVRTAVAAISGFFAISNFLKTNSPVPIVIWALILIAMRNMPQLIKYFVGT